MEQKSNSLLMPKGKPKEFLSKLRLLKLKRIN